MIIATMMMMMMMMMISFLCPVALNPASGFPEADALTTRPTRRSVAGTC